MTNDSLQSARATFSGKTMTETQLTKAHAIAGILHAEIKRSGSFKEELTDYAHAFARGERFDALRGETMIRDIYTARYDQSLNQTRMRLKAQEDNLPERSSPRVLECAESIATLIQEGPTQPFYQAYDRAATTLAAELGVTQTAAKTLMKDSFQAAHHRDLYEAGKEIEAAYHTPVRTKEVAARTAERLQSQSQSRSRS
ncbi:MULTISPECIES: hypothetical protein [Paracoccaceae]|uniref:hypothetical protein n=1 Tax=Paracoccaceae TaxID=31989 RepID=UPI0032976468